MEKFITELPKLPPAGECLKPPTHQVSLSENYRIIRYRFGEKGFSVETWRGWSLFLFLIPSKPRKRFSLSVERRILLRCCKPCRSAPHSSFNEKSMKVLMFVLPPALIFLLVVSRSLFSRETIYCDVSLLDIFDEHEPAPHPQSASHFSPTGDGLNIHNFHLNPSYAFRGKFLLWAPLANFSVEIQAKTRKLRINTAGSWVRIFSENYPTSDTRRVDLLRLKAAGCRWEFKLAESFVELHQFSHQSNESLNPHLRSPIRRSSTRVLPLLPSRDEKAAI